MEMLEIKTTFKKGTLIITLGGELKSNNIKQLDSIIKLFENGGFSNVIIESKVKCDKRGYKKLKENKKNEQRIICLRRR